MAKYITVICRVKGQTVLKLIDDFDCVDDNVFHHNDSEDQTHNGFNLNVIKQEVVEEEVEPLNDSCDSLEYDDYFDESKTFDYLWEDANSGTANGNQSMDGYKKYLTIIKTTGRQLFVCKYQNCDYQTLWKNAIINHIRSNHLYFYPFVCGFPDCGKSFAIRSNLNNHRKVHSKSSGKDVSLGETSQSSADFDHNYSQSVVKRKNVFTKNSNPSQCSKTEKKKSFAQNIRKKSKNKVFGKLESKPTNLINIKKKNIKEEPNKPIRKRGRPSLSLGPSDLKPAFIGIKSVEQYMKQTEKNGKIWRVCLFPDCSYGSKYATSIVYHIRNQHLDDKPYVCPLCDKSFAMRTNLNNHMKSHKSTKL